MNTGQLNNLQAVDALPVFPESVKNDILQLAAVGLTAEQIAVAAELEPDLATAFVTLAKVPGSRVARLIDEGRANGVAAPQMKLQAAAAAGNIDAIKTLLKLQRENRFKELLAYMDDDELPG